ncbi:hypothetical protein GCM10012285_26520 [Streptomyces kronopolitis]|uniref:Uncharacterized protein n=1 Tax=Streptomyces kronopolitis TaxID=1612435 RepID=A0ABQ2JDD1_9ACTN|nr:hypothetical protein GCM10012285_26520 [Streptomyces kronopolitis]
MPEGVRGRLRACQALSGRCRTVQRLRSRPIVSGCPYCEVMAEKTGITYIRVADGARRLGASVHMPRIGCGLAGGVWSRVEPLISVRLARGGIPVTVYDR